MKCVLVLSDIHLSPTFESEALPFRSATFSPAAYLSQTIDRALEAVQHAGGSLEIILNGDVFDFDVAQDASEAASATRALDTRTQLGAAQAIQEMLSHHLPFILALRRALAMGATIVILPGNHDAQLGFDAVRSTLCHALGPAMIDRLIFFPWYYLAAGGAVLVEHGHLYDPLCTVARVRVDTAARAEATVGTVSAFYAPLLLPGMDPFVTDPFAERGTLRATLSRAMARGGPFVACAGELLVAGADRTSQDDVDHLADACPSLPTTQRYVGHGDNANLVDYRRQMFAKKATLGQLFAVCTGSLGYASTVENRIARAMTAGTSVHGASVAVVGHTHHPGVTMLPNAKTLLNSGSWTPRRTKEEPIGSFAWIEVGDDGHIHTAAVKHVERGA